MKKLFVILLFFFLPQKIFASEFSFEFDWSDLKKCTTGNPNIVKNPIFTLQNVPNGTKFILLYELLFTYLEFASKKVLKVRPKIIKAMVKCMARRY